MATKKYRLNRKNSDGSYDVIHYETSSNIVLRPDGSTVEESLLNNNLPSGIIAMWSGAANAIPSGWLLCDGSNGTPDLRNRFIVGAGSSYSVGNTGGSDTVTLSTAQIPSHTHEHNLSVTAASDHVHAFSGVTSESYGIMSVTSGKAVYSSDPGAKYTIVDVLQSSSSNTHSHTYSANSSAAGTHGHNLSGSIYNEGSGQSHENRPPYYALCFIMKQ